MSLTLYGSSVPEPTPEAPVPHTRRRYLIIIATVLALILGGGSAAFLLLNSSPILNQTAPNAYTPPNDGATVTDGPTSASPSASASASPTASPSHSPSPSRSPTVRPSVPAPGGAVIFRAPGGVLCPSVDFQPVIDLSKQPGTQQNDAHTDGYNYVKYTCDEQFGKVHAGVDALIFNDAAGAAAMYADKKSVAPATSDRISGVGTDAYGYVFQTSMYITVALDGNLILQIRLTGTGGVPVPGKLRDEGAVKMAPPTIGNLAVKS
jgi:hypothetical protein